jgi:hypothetical protein
VDMLYRVTDLVMKIWTHYWNIHVIWNS